MEYEFKSLESLIRNAIERKAKSNLSSEEHFAQIRSAVAAERDRIKRSFPLVFWSLENDHQKRSILQYHLQALTLLIDELYAISKTARSSRQKTDQRLAEEAFFLYDQLEDIAGFLQNSFAGHLNTGMHTSAPHTARILKALSDRYSQFQNRLEDTKNEVLKICSTAISSFLNTKEQSITYSKLHYMTLLLETVGELVDSADLVPVEKQVQDALVSVNFNSQEYFTYQTTSIQEQLEKLDSDTSRLERLALQLKTISQIPLGSDLSFTQGLRPIKTLLSEWILDEIAYLERKRELTNTSQGVQSEFIRKEFKLEFDMSVSQFAFFIKSFTETGVIQNKNTSELIRFLAKFVKTKRSENISYESFRMKYYNVESGTRDAVRNLLHNAIGYINSN